MINQEKALDRDLIRSDRCMIGWVLIEEKLSWRVGSNRADGVGMGWETRKKQQSFPYFLCTINVGLEDDRDSYAITEEDMM